MSLFWVFVTSVSIAVSAEVTAAEKILRFNQLEGTYEYATEEAELKLNTFDNVWEHAESDTQLRYNGLEDRHEYAGEDEKLQINVFENQWEFIEEGETIRPTLDQPTSGQVDSELSVEPSPEEEPLQKLPWE